MKRENHKHLSLYLSEVFLQGKFKLKIMQSVLDGAAEPGFTRISGEKEFLRNY